MRRDRYVRPRAKVFTGHPFEPVMWPIGILLSGAITALLRLHLKNVFMGVAYGNAACSGFARRVSIARLTYRCRISAMSWRDNSMCPRSCLRVRFESLFSLCVPKCPCMLVLIASELVAHPEQRAIDHGAVVAGQVHDTGFNDEAAKFDKMPRALAALDLPLAHVTSRPCRLMAVACRPVAPERCQSRGQLPVHFATTVPERTRPHVLPTPPSL